MLNEKFSPGIPQNFAGGIWDKFLPFVNIIHDAGPWNLAWILHWIIWTCIPKIASLAFFVWSEFIHFYFILKILSVNYSLMKKARDTKFWCNIPMDLTYNFGKNFVPGFFYWAYFSNFVKKSLNWDSDQLLPNEKD